MAKTTKATNKTTAALKNLKTEVDNGKKIEDKGATGTAKTEAIPMPPMVTYTVEDINQVMNYLGNRPYMEVAGLIQIMQSGKSS